MESEAHGGGATRAADEDPGAVAFATGTARDSHSMPGGAGGQDDPGDPACPADAVSHGVHGGAGDLANPRGPRTAGESGGAAGAILHIPGPPHAPGPGGDAAPGARVLSNRALQFRLTAEDPGLLQRSIAFCLEQLSLVMRSLQHFVAPVSAKPQHGRGV
ncbi:hypothetical protein G4228_019733 [Cervus hanglu yarkandensis]|uniref:EKC/KEOPS complex subunit LAGE3-like n=1 Tax=Cervus hanglu yarkandensis TaxID=84702 RepID=A0A833RL60_9CERV|nr:hypothetical protein G4228_019733 [Cervus hanglu yarkandensis]